MRGVHTVSSLPIILPSKDILYELPGIDLNISAPKLHLGSFLSVSHYYS
jgi:hypothetical protein